MASVRSHIEIRGIYGGMPEELLEGGKTLAESGVNAIWIGSGGLNSEIVERLREQDCHVYAEFNTLNDARYLEEHPDAAPVGPDREVCPPPDGWYGVCPTHAGYRRYRMEAFARTLAEHEIDGVWLDYHHSHASWEQAEPNLPDTCFCGRCLDAFATATGADPGSGAHARSERLLGPLREEWVIWRCAVLTDWVREFREILDRTRPAALLGTFHCPWSEDERDGALRNKLHIDLPAQAEYLDVFSPMPYHARFGHASDPEWISRQVSWLGSRLGLRGTAGERLRIWPIVQLSDWGESVPAEQVAAVLDHGTRAPATGVMAFNWGGLRRLPENVREMTRFYREISGSG